MTTLDAVTELHLPVVPAVPRLVLPPSLARLARFVGSGAVGLSGLGVNTATLFVLAGGLGLHYLAAACVASQVAGLWNFALSDRLVFRGLGSAGWPVRMARFMTLNVLALLVSMPLLALVVSVLGVPYLLGNALTIVLVFTGRFLANERLVYSGPSTA